MQDAPELQPALRVAAVATLLIAGFAALSGSPGPGVLMAVAGFALLAAARPRRSLQAVRATRRQAGRASA